MRTLVTLFLLLLACGGAYADSAASSRFAFEETVRRDLAAQGLVQGFGDDGASYVAVVSAARPFAASASAFFADVRGACFRHAELKAQGEILTSLGTQLAGKTSVSRGGAAGARTKRIHTLVAAFARRTLGGFDVVACREGRAEARYVVALALRWRRACEELEGRLAAGGVAPSPAWQEECRAWLAASGARLLPPSTLFVDSCGALHVLGAGLAQTPEARGLRQQAAINKAVLMARKNLQLRFLGTQSVRTRAAALLETGGAARCSTTDAVYEALGAVGAQGALPAGTVEIDFRRVTSPEADGTLYQAVYGF